MKTETKNRKSFVERIIASFFWGCLVVYAFVAYYFVFIKIFAGK